MGEIRNYYLLLTGAREREERGEAAEGRRLRQQPHQ